MKGLFSMEQNIKVKKREVYGKELIYPVCQKALNFTRLTGRKTLTPSDLFIIANLGYSVDYTF